MFRSAEYDNAFLLTLLFTCVRWAMMAYAAWRDARTRTFPNGLAAALVLVCASEAFLSNGLTSLSVPDGMGGLQEGGFLPQTALHALAVNAALAFAVFIALFIFELLWRRFLHEPGLGIGDLKYLFALMLLDPFGALLSFALGLIAMSLAAFATHHRSLPLLPFAVPAYFAVALTTSGLLPFP